MEPLFPDLLFLGPFFAPLVIRIGLTLLFIAEAMRLLKATNVREKVRGIWSLVLVLFLGVGLFTQLAAIAGIVYVFVVLFAAKESGSLLKNKTTAFLTIIMLFSLVITGAGYTPFPFADLPY